MPSPKRGFFAIGKFVKGQQTRTVFKIFACSARSRVRLNPVPTFPA